jgi:hypothetical protein
MVCRDLLELVISAVKERDEGPENRDSSIEILIGKSLPSSKLPRSGVSIWAYEMRELCAAKIPECELNINN